MKLFGSYLKYRAKIIITCLVVIGIFASSYFLFDMPAIAVLYPLLLTVCSGLIAAGFDYAFFIKRHNRIKENLEELPNPKNLIEEDYQQIIKLMREEAQRAEFLISYGQIRPPITMISTNTGSTNMKYGLSHNGIFMPSPLLVSSIYLSNPHPNFVTQNSI